MKSMLFYACFLLCYALDAYAANAPVVGMKAPDFKVISGSGTILQNKNIEGKIAGIFYQPRFKEIVDQQRPFEAALDTFYKSLSSSQQAQIFRGAFIDTQNIPWLFRWLTRMKMRSQSKKLGISVYGDWDGSFASAFHSQLGIFNFYIIDPSGEICYYSQGPIEPSEYPTIFEMLRSHLKQE